MATNLKIMKEQACYILMHTSNISCATKSVVAEVKLYEDSNYQNSISQLLLSCDFVQNKIRNQSGASWNMSSLARSNYSYMELRGWNNMRNLNVIIPDDRKMLLRLWANDLTMSDGLVLCLSDSLNDFSEGIHSQDKDMAINQASIVAYYIYRELERINSICTDIKYLIRMELKQK